MKKYAFRANIEHKISSTINLGLSLTMTKVDNNRVGNSVLQSRLTTPPNLPVMQDDGSYTFSDNNGVITFDNPVGVINEKVDWHTNFRSLNNAFVEWNIIKGLKLIMPPTKVIIPVLFIPVAKRMEKPRKSRITLIRGLTKIS